MDEHYFTPSPTTDDARFPLTAVLAGEERSLVSAASVFSGHRLDRATAVLLNRLDELTPVPADGRLLDLGCGWGPLALSAALLHPGCEVWAVDVSDRARELTRENADRLGVEVHVAAPEEVPPGLVFDTLWSNPPIRIGREALDALLQEWIGRLSPRGTAALVVGRNLGADPLARRLAERLPGREVRKAASAKGFRVLEVGPVDRD